MFKNCKNIKEFAKKISSYLMADPVSKVLIRKIENGEIPSNENNEHDMNKETD